MKLRAISTALGLVALGLVALALGGCAVDAGPDTTPRIGGDMQPTCGLGEAGRIRRITDVEYADRVRGVLGLAIVDTGALPRGGDAEPFTEPLARQYASASESVAGQAIEPAVMRSLLGGDASMPATDAELAAFYDAKVSSLWQRNLAPSEAARLTTLDRSASKVGEGGASRAFELLIQAVLQAPSFLFRAECN